MLIDQCAEKDPRFKVIHKENGGTARARNAGLDVATGKYITFLDVDDTPVPEMYEKMINLMEKSQADCGTCGFWYRANHQKKDGTVETTYLEEKIYPAHHYQSQEEIKKDLVQLWDSNILFNVWNKLYRMDTLRERNVRFTDGHVHSEDVDFNRHVIENIQSLVILDEPLYYYIVEQPGSTTERFWENYYEIRDNDFHLVIEHFKRLGLWDEVSREYACRYFIERISGVIENLFHASKEQLSNKMKYQRAYKIIHSDDVIYAGKYARCRSKKMKVLAYPIIHRQVLVAYALHWMIYKLRTANPGLFYKMKNHR